MGQNQHFEESIIIKVFLNEATLEEVRSLEAWIGEDPKNRQKFLELQEIWNSIEVERSATSEVLEKDWKSIAERITQSSEVFSPSGKIKPLFVLVSKIAAILVIGAVGYFLPMFFFNTDTQRAFNVISVPNGSKTEIELPDGSKVLLNAGSSLRYPERFMSGLREVYLEGEAFFKVQSDLSHRFLVKTKGVTIKVYGTAFNVRSYDDDPTIETTLEEGKISISLNADKDGNSKEILMEPNQHAIWYSDLAQSSLPGKGIILKKGIDIRMYTAWRDGILIIKSETLQDLSIKLERRYGVKIVFGDEDVKSIRFTGTLKNETVEQVMELIRLVSNVEFSIRENVITIGKLK